MAVEIDAVRIDTTTGALPECKRAKVACTAPAVDDDDGDGKFSLTFDCTTALRTLVEVVSALLCRAEFKVVRLPGGQGQIQVDSIDPKKSCLVVAHLDCRLRDFSGSPGFCVNTVDFNHCLRSIPAHYAVDLSMDSETSMLNVRAYEALAHCHEMNFDISTLVNEDKAVKMTDLDYQLLIEVDTVSLRRIVRNCIQLHGEELQFRVMQPKEPSSTASAVGGGDRTPDRNVKYTVLTIESEGTSVRQREKFHSITDERNGQATVIRTEHEENVHGCSETDMSTCFDETFCASYLNLYLKNLDRNMITMRLSKGKPLILTYPLGGTEGSFVCLVLAARAK